MVIAIGTDITEVARIAASIERFGEAFLARVFTAAERAYCQAGANAAERFAVRFAAKEAAMKALGTGWSQGVRWLDLEVLRLPGGKPTLAMHGAAGQHAARLGVRRVEISLTHTRSLALAEVLFEG